MRLTKFIKKYKTTLCLPIFLVSLFSCSNNTEKKDDKNQSITTNKIYFWHTFGQNLQEELDSKIGDFEKIIKDNEGVDVDIVPSYVGSYDEIMTQIERGFASGNSPTIAVAYPDHVANYLSHEDFDEEYVYNLEKLMNDSTIGYGKNPYLGDSEDQNGFVKAFYEESTNYIKEGTYSLPFMKSTEVLMYNKDIVENILLPRFDSTITDPEEYMKNLTWDKFVELLKFVKQDMSSYGSNLEVPLIYDSDENLIISRLYQEDVPFISYKDGKGSVDFNNDAAKAIVKELKQNYDDGLLKTKGSNNNEYGSNSFTVGKCLFTVGSSGGAGYNDPGSASFNVGVCKVPYSSKPLYVSQGPTLTLLKSVGVNDATNNFRKEYGWKFLKYLTNPSVNTDICFNGSQGYIPVRTSSYTTGYYAQYLEEQQDFLAKTANVVVNDINGDYLYTPAFKGSNACRDYAGSIIANVFLDKFSVDEAFDYAERMSKLEM